MPQDVLRRLLFASKGENRARAWETVEKHWSPESAQIFSILSLPAMMISQNESSATRWSGLHPFQTESLPRA